MVLFRQYRFLKQPEKKMCEGDRFGLALHFKALYCFKAPFGSPVPRDGSSVNSFSDKCNPNYWRIPPVVIKCRHCTPYKCTVFLTFGERRKQKSGFVLAPLPKTQENLINSHPLSSLGCSCSPSDLLLSRYIFNNWMPFIEETCEGFLSQNEKPPVGYSL